MGSYLVLLFAFLLSVILLYVGHFCYDKGCGFVLGHDVGGWFTVIMLQLV